MGRVKWMNIRDPTGRGGMMRTRLQTCGFREGWTLLAHSTVQGNSLLQIITCPPTLRHNPFLSHWAGATSAISVRIVILFKGYVKIEIIKKRKKVSRFIRFNFKSYLREIKIKMIKRKELKESLLLKKNHTLMYKLLNHFKRKTTD